MLHESAKYCFTYESEVFFLYKTCVTCPKLGISCDGANLITMSAAEILEWCKLRKKHLGWSNAYLSEMSLVPKGTIDRVFSADPTDFKYETMRPLITALVGGKPGANPCPDPFDHSAAHLREIIELKSAETADLQKRLDEWKSRHVDSIAYYRRLYCVLRKVTLVLGGLLALALCFIIAMLIYDLMTPGVGYFNVT